MNCLDAWQARPISSARSAVDAARINCLQRGMRDWRVTRLRRMNGGAISVVPVTGTHTLLARTESRYAVIQSLGG